MQYQSTQAYGASFKFSLWYNKENETLDYEEEIQLSLLCPFEFSDFQFDSHKCYVEYGDDKYGLSKVKLNPANIAYRNLTIQFGDDPIVIGGFQLEFVSMSQVINHMTCYKFSALIG